MTSASLISCTFSGSLHSPTLKSSSAATLSGLLRSCTFPDSPQLLKRSTARQEEAQGRWSSAQQGPADLKSRACDWAGAGLFISGAQRILCGFFWRYHPQHLRQVTVVTYPLCSADGHPTCTRHPPLQFEKGTVRALVRKRRLCEGASWQCKRRQISHNESCSPQWVSVTPTLLIWILAQTPNPSTPTSRQKCRHQERASSKAANLRKDTIDVAAPVPA